MNNLDLSHSELNNIIKNNTLKITIIYSQQKENKLPKIVELYELSQDKGNRNLSNCKIDYSSSVVWFSQFNYMLYKKYKSIFNLFSTEEIFIQNNIFNDNQDVINI